jgi:hypothetical protein
VLCCARQTDNAQPSSSATPKILDRLICLLTQRYL